VIALKSLRLALGDLPVPVVRPVCPRKKQRRLMVREKSEDRVLLQGGVMPAGRSGSSLGGRGKAILVEQTAGQLRLLIVTAENPEEGAARGVSVDQFVDARVRVPEAIVNVESVTPVTMEEVVRPLVGGAVEGGVEQGSAWPGWADGRRAAGAVAVRWS
jgi:hypothetical protein